MDLYEYQARELLEEQGIPTPKAIFAQNSHEVAEAADQIGYPNVIKAQVKICLLYTSPSPRDRG